MDKYYRNRQTNEITESKSEAMKWYREGAQVEVWENGRMIIAFLM